MSPKLYGLANLDTLSPKRQRTLPVDCKVYDLLNFATEIATHHASTEPRADCRPGSAASSAGNTTWKALPTSLATSAISS